MLDVNKIVFWLKLFCLVLIVVLFLSCRVFQSWNYKKQHGVESMQLRAIEAVLNNHYRNLSRKKTKDIKNIGIINKSYFKEDICRQYFSKCVFCRNLIRDTINIVEAPKILNEKAKLISEGEKLDSKTLLKAKWFFSPLRTTTAKNIFVIASKVSNYESVAIFYHLIRKDKNGKFEYLMNIDGDILWF